MTDHRLPLVLTLGIAPTSRGFGWVALEGPLQLYDWGTVYVRSEKNLRSVRHFERVVDRLRPATVVLEDLTSPKRSGRVCELHGLLKSSAYLKNKDVATYGREQVRSYFATMGAQHHHEIAEVIAHQFPELAHRLPRKRSAWMSADQRQGLFEAAALALTHFHLGSGDVLESFKL